MSYCQGDCGEDTCVTPGCGEDRCLSCGRWIEDCACSEIDWEWYDEP